MVEARSDGSVLTLMQLAAVPLKRLAYSLVAGAGAGAGVVVGGGGVGGGVGGGTGGGVGGEGVGSAVAPDGVPGSGQHLMFDAPEQKLVMVELPSIDICCWRMTGRACPC